jgi:hypothetical protein
MINSLLSNTFANTDSNCVTRATSTKDDEKTSPGVSQRPLPCSQAPTTPLRAKNVSKQ